MTKDENNGGIKRMVNPNRFGIERIAYLVNAFNWIGIARLFYCTCL